MSHDRNGTGVLDLGSALLIFGGVAASLAVASRVGRPLRSFRGQTVVITGGSRGLGLALAERFAAEGARLALVARSADELDRAVTLLRSSEAEDVTAVVCDVRDRDAVGAAVAEIGRRTGRIDVLVNNAGVMAVTPFEHAQLQDFEDSLETHFWGPLCMVRACLPYFLRQRGGRIVNIASIGGRVAVPHLLPYVVGKFALVGLSQGLAAELARAGISVTTVAPHLMQTGSHRNAVVRGQHRKEAIWFALGSASRLTAMDAGRAARQIVEAARAGRPHCTPGWPARAAEIAQAIAPNLVVALAAAAARFVLPSAGGSEGASRHLSADLDLGVFARFFATEAAMRFNQQVAPDEARHVRQPAG